jgi:hypothetical protein
LSNPAGATLYGAEATGKILEDDNIRLEGRVAIGTVTVRFGTVAKLLYRVEWTDSIAGNPDWHALADWERHVGTGGLAIAVDPDPGDRPQRFYRVRRLPAEP